MASRCTVGIGVGYCRTHSINSQAQAASLCFKHILSIVGTRPACGAVTQAFAVSSLHLSFRLFFRSSLSVRLPMTWSANGCAGDCLEFWGERWGERSEGGQRPGPCGLAHLP